MRSLRIALLLAVLSTIAVMSPKIHAAEIKGWNLLTTDGPRGRVTAALFKNTIYATETWKAQDYEMYSADGYTLYLYKSTDGAHWTKSTTPWPSPSGDVRLVVYRDMLWAIRSLEAGSNPGLEIWRTSDGNTWTKLPSKTPGSRDGFAVAVFKDKLWLTGGEVYMGHTSPSVTINDIWKTDDGTSWSLVASGNMMVTWEPVYDHVLIAFQDKLRMLGGTTGYQSGTSNCYQSVDGKIWIYQPGWNDGDGIRRGGLSAAVYNNKLYAFGGQVDAPHSHYGTPIPGSTTSSFMTFTEGSEWSNIASFGATQDHASIVLGDRVFIIGGRYWDGSNLKWSSSVWATPLTGYDALAPVSAIGQVLPRRAGQTVSIDMINTGSLPWTSSGGFSLNVISDNKKVTTNSTLPMLAGVTVKPGEKCSFTLPVDLSKLWGTADIKLQMHQGIVGNFGDVAMVSLSCPVDRKIGWHRIETRQQLTGNGGWFGNRMMLTATDKYLWETFWRSKNGLDWIQTSGPDSEPWRLVEGTTIVDRTAELAVFNNKLIALGSHHVWTSNDGMSWSRSDAKWTNIDGARPFPSSSCVLGNKLFVWITYDIPEGIYNTYEYENQIWSTSDGSSWSKLSTFDKFYNCGKMVAFNDKLWVFGEIRIKYIYGEASQYDDGAIYSSPDGKTWTKVGDLPRETCLHGVTVYRDKLWAADEDGGMWSSDGIHWEPASSVPAYADFEVYDDRLWSISPDGELWSGSADNYCAMLSRSALDFGHCDLAGAGSKGTVDVYNLGVSMLGFTGSGAEIVSSRPGEFTFASTPNISPVSIGGTRTMNILFKPSRIGPTSATLQVTTNDPKHPVLTVKLTGEGIAAQPLKAGNIIAYLLGKSSDAAGLDKNADSKINIADLVCTQNSPIQVTSPSSATKTGTEYYSTERLPIIWKAPVGISRVNIDLARNHSPVMMIKSNTVNDGYSSCTLPGTVIPGDDYSMIVSDAAHSSVQGESQFFTVKAPYDFYVQYPNGGEVLRRGAKIPISWHVSYPTNNIRLEVWKNDAPYKTLVSSRPVSSGNVYYWTIPDDFATGDNFRIVVNDPEHSWRWAYGNPFSIVK